MNIGELFVRITATNDVGRGVKQASAELGGLSTVAKRLGGALAAAFSVREIFQFGKAAVQEFVAAEEVWNRLAGTVENAGVSFASARSEIEAAADAMERTSTVGDEEFAATLQTLVRISNDYAASMRNVSVVADLAAGAQIDLNTAAELVGKAMAGNTATLSRYGIVVREGEDAIAAIADRFRGLAQNETRTLGGQVDMLSNAWGNFKEAIGQALAEAVDGPPLLTRLTDTVREATGWINENSESFRVLGDVLTFGLRQVGYVAEGFFIWLGALKKTWEWVVKVKDATLEFFNLADDRAALSEDFWSHEGAAFLAANVTTATAATRQLNAALLDTVNIVAEMPDGPLAMLAGAPSAETLAMVRVLQEFAAEVRSTTDATTGLDLEMKEVAATVPRMSAEMAKAVETLQSAAKGLAGGAADAFADFLVNGKNGFKEFVDSAIRDLARLAARMAAMAIFKGILGVVSGGTSIGVDVATGALGGLASRQAVSLPSFSASASGAAGSAASIDVDRLVSAALQAMPMPQTANEAGRDAFWVRLVATALPIAQSRGLRV